MQKYIFTSHQITPFGSKKGHCMKSHHVLPPEQACSMWNQFQHQTFQDSVRGREEEEEVKKGPVHAV